MSQRYPSKLELPSFQFTPATIRTEVNERISRSKSLLDQIASLPQKERSFQSVSSALDLLNHDEGLTMSRIHLLQNVSPDELIRKAAEEAEIDFQNYAIEKAYHPGIYQCLKSLEADSKNWAPSEKKLFEEQLRSCRRLGLHLGESEQKELKALQKELAQIETEFSTAINSHHDEIWVKPSDLTGLDASFIEHLQKNSDGLVRISLQYPEYLPVMEYCDNESIRKSLTLKKYNTAAKENSPRLQKMVELRYQIAKRLGYPSWNHYVIEERMAKKPEKVFEFLTQFESKLRPLAKRELEELTKLKRERSKDPHAKIESWDSAFYSALNKKMKFSINLQELKNLFPLPQVLSGMFNFIEQLFNVKITEHAKGTFPTWHPDIQLFTVSDSKGDLGAFYLDLFPRPGKYGHAAAFSLTDGRLLENGIYQRPVSAMVCNFPKDGEQLLSHHDVETLFHEFGHILHGLLTWAKYSHFSGTSVAWDFVEAPSQILENWVWDYSTLKSFARSTPTIQLTEELVEKMNAAHRAGMGLFYLRQVSFAKSDLTIHGDVCPRSVIDEINRVLSETYLPVPEATAFGAGFGHLVGYASGYYGYAWADVMAADMFSLFKKQGLMDQELGAKLRKEIYESGSERDEELSLQAFLGRPLSSDAFFQGIGLTA